MNHVKKFLNRALECIKMIDILKNELKEKRKGIADINVVLDEIRNSNISSMIEIRAINLIKLEEDIQKYIEKRDKAIKEIREVIDKLDDDAERKILELKYIDCMEWWKIAKIFGYSERQMQRKFNKALEKVSNILKDVSRCH